MLAALRVHEDAERNRSTAHHHIVIDAFNALSGLHSCGVNDVGARQSQHPRGSSPLTKEGKPPRHEVEDGRKSEKLRHGPEGTI